MGAGRRDGKGEREQVTWHFNKITILIKHLTGTFFYLESVRLSRKAGGKTGRASLSGRRGPQGGSLASV